jgi:hypothetical protein
MRTSHALTALAAFTAGVSTAATLRRRAGSRPPVVPTAATAPESTSAPAPEHDAVVLPFERPSIASPAHEQPASPARCGESGGITRAGAPCAARATAGGRCHHHRMAA